MVPDKCRWATETAFLPPEISSYGLQVPTLLFTVTCILFPCRLGKYWGPPRLKTRMSRQQLSPSRGKEKWLHQGPKIKNRYQMWRSWQPLLLRDTICLHKWDCHVKRWGPAYEICLRALSELFDSRVSSKNKRTQLNSDVTFLLYSYPNEALCHLTVRNVFKPAAGRKLCVIFLKIETHHMDGDCSPQWEAAHFHSEIAPILGVNTDKWKCKRQHSEEEKRNTKTFHCCLK